MKATIETADGETREVEGGYIKEGWGSVVVFETHPKDTDLMEGVADALLGEGVEKFEGATIVEMEE